MIFVDDINNSLNNIVVNVFDTNNMHFVVTKLNNNYLKTLIATKFLMFFLIIAISNSFILLYSFFEDRFFAIRNLIVFNLSFFLSIIFLILQIFYLFPFIQSFAPNASNINLDIYEYTNYYLNMFLTYEIISIIPIKLLKSE